jgi:hypothetical protein
MAEAEDDWRLDFIAYILENRVPKGKVECEKIITRSANYVVIGTKIYRRSSSNGVLMRCILRSEGLQLLQEIRGEECDNHATSTNLVGKAFRSGFYWPTALANAQDLVRRCKGCQLFTKQQHIPAQALRTIPLSWPFHFVGPRLSGNIQNSTWRLQSYPGGGGQVHQMDQGPSRHPCHIERGGNIHGRHDPLL